MPISITGVDSTLRNLAALATRLPNEADEFFVAEAQAILDKALQIVPHDTGELARSGEVKRTGGNIGAGVGRQLFDRTASGQFTGRSVEVAFGKSGPSQIYSRVVHDTPSELDPPSWQGKTVQFQNGGRPQFLAIPFRERAGNLTQRLASHLRSKLGGP